MAMHELQASSTPAIADAARYSEDLGFESLWVPDLLIGDGTPTLDPALTLAAAAAVTEQVKIGFSVLAVPLRPAPWLATQTATLQHLSGNRLLLGVGCGGFPDSPFWQALGMSGQQRGQTTDATLQLLPQLLSGEPVELPGTETPCTLAPSAPLPPVLVGGSQRAFRRVLDYGDGWFPSLTTPTDLAAAVTRLRQLAADRDVSAPASPWADITSWALTKPRVPPTTRSSTTSSMFTAWNRR